MLDLLVLVLYLLLYLVNGDDFLPQTRILLHDVILQVRQLLHHRILILLLLQLLLLLLLLVQLNIGGIGALLVIGVMVVVN